MHTQRFDYAELKRLREFLRWSLADLTARCQQVKFEVSESTLANWEQGETAPDADKLVLLAQVFGVGVERFYKQEDGTP